MTTPSVREVDVASLGPLERIAGGGQGLVYRLRDTPDGPVYKEYLPRVVDDLDVDALRAFVRFADDLDDEDRATLLGVVAWPEVVVRRDGVVRGFLMRQVPPEFSTELRFGGAESEVLATAQFLLNPPEYLNSVGLRVTQRFRMEFLTDTAKALTLLHGLDIVVGDFSPNNLLFSLHSTPRCFFVDSDSMRLGEYSVLPQGETPDWRVGDHGEEPGTQASDVYKFGLLAARLFAGDQSTPDPALAPVRLRRHLKRCLAVSPEGRPSARDLVLPLTRTLAQVSRTAEPEQEPTPVQEPAQEPEPEPEPAAASIASIPRQRGAGPPRPAPVRRGWGGGAAAIVIGLLILVGLFAAEDDDGSGSLSGGSPAFSNLPSDYEIPGLPGTAYNPLPTYVPPYPSYRLPTFIPPPSLFCLVDVAADVRGGGGLASARESLGSMCTTGTAEQWPSLRDHAPYDGVRIVGFFGEGEPSPSATVDLTDDAGACWRTNVGFDAGYRVRSVGPLSPCG